MQLCTGSVFTVIAVVRFEMSLALLPSIVSEWPTKSVFVIYILVEKVHSMVQATLAKWCKFQSIFQEHLFFFVQRIRFWIRWNF